MTKLKNLTMALLTSRRGGNYSIVPLPFKDMVRLVCEVFSPTQFSSGLGLKPLIIHPSPQFIHFLPSSKHGLD